MKKLPLVLFFIGFTSYQASAEISSDDMNKANNPLTPMFGLNFHDYIGSSIFGTDDDANTFFLRGTMPHDLFGLPQIARLSVPYLTVPSPASTSGLGDINLFDIFLLPVPGIEFGIGPYFVFPTASEDETGADKWQLGLSTTAIAKGSWGLLGGLITYQHDVAGDDDRPTQNILNVQPFFIFNLPQAYYLRSVGIWYFDLERGDYYIPIGAGFGKIWKMNQGTVINAFVEPQWTVAHEGDGVPNFQTFLGLNLQFPMSGS